jgi:hypothetical protein
VFFLDFRKTSGYSDSGGWHENCVCDKARLVEKSETYPAWMGQVRRQLTFYERNSNDRKILSLKDPVDHCRSNELCRCRL